jgi:hypothetical protein
MNGDWEDDADIDRDFREAFGIEQGRARHGEGNGNHE